MMLKSDELRNVPSHEKKYHFYYHWGVQDCCLLYNIPVSFLSLLDEVGDDCKWEVVSFEKQHDLQ